ncbi:glycosyltransferase family 9 protein [Pleionea sp. CnH1-48]|uniref:glycosyltransferase family 9 protein n=1 Tax=Pleionea sp. CnH1-48 TaxID=2954494 RepID=UPI0020983EA6|nr:glycosyltransferase family 9 protein [Pleionea sp. CnH1-48]MCO7223883.1 glycosyltransferase family 9 protein [Pleionea sp. CnH1-48]
MPQLAPSSLCVLRLSAIGDVCHAVSAVQAIQRHYPTAKITWIVGKIEAQMLQGLQGVELIVFDKSQGWRAFQALRKQLKGRRFDVLLHMQLALRANLAAGCIPADRKIGFARQRSKELHSWFVSDHIDSEQGFHVLDGFRDFTRAIGVPDTPPQWDMPISDDDLQWAGSILPQSNQPVLVISPAASKAERNWLAERYAAVADYAAERGFQVVISGGPSTLEKELSASIESYAKHSMINLTGQTSLKQLLALLKRASVVLAPDSGPAHIAVTQNTPVIGLYAHSNPKRTGPYLYQDYVVEVYAANAEKQYGKPVSELPWGARIKGDELMSHISVAQVTEMLEKVIVQEGILLPESIPS